MYKVCNRDAQALAGKLVRVIRLVCHFMKNRVFYFALAAVPLACSRAPAQSPTLMETVVTATRSATRSDALVSDVVLIDRTAIEAASARTLPELLARQAGVQFNTSGGLGSLSGISVRGTEARHTILLIDGVRYGSATAGTPIWDNIPLELIERIEVLKGPASALYGSEGVGGVVQVFTRKGVKGFKPFAAVSLGKESRRTLSAGAAGGQGNVSYALGAQVLRQTGFSATNARVPFGNFNADRDGFQQDAFNASIGWQFTPDWKLDAGTLYADGQVQLDDGPGRDARTAVRTQTGFVGIQGKPATSWQTQLRLSQSADVADAIVSAFLPSNFKTRQNEIVWTNHIDTPLGLALLGAEKRRQKVSGSTNYDVRERSINAVFAGLNCSSGRHSWQIILRRDSNSQFGGSSTGFAGYGLAFAPGWRANVSHGTSFVAPSFNQLYFPRFGNPLLQPEKGRNTDLGLAWKTQSHEVKLVRYDNKIRGYITNTTVAANIPQSRIKGFTLGYAAQMDRLTVNTSVDALNPRNELNGRQLPRRARIHAAVNVDYDFGAWKGGASVLQVGQRFDDTANTQRLPGYATLDLHASYPLAADWTVQAALNNVTNKSYETALGYNQPGRSLFVTVRWQPK